MFVGAAEDVRCVRLVVVKPVVALVRWEVVVFEVAAEYILSRSGKHHKVGGKVTDRFKEVLAVLRTAAPKTVAHLM